MEIVKAGIIRSAPLFRLLENRSNDLLAPGTLPPGERAALLTEIVTRSVAIKAEIVGLDERESGPRMLLNLGHTVGHAIEAVTGYTALLHGEAIGWGMLIAIGVSEKRGLLRPGEAARMGALVRALGVLPPFTASAEALLAAAGRDKKNAGGRRRFILPVAIGDAIVVEDVSDGELLAAIGVVLHEAEAAHAI